MQILNIGLLIDYHRQPFDKLHFWNKNVKQFSFFLSLPCLIYYNKWGFSLGEQTI